MKECKNMVVFKLMYNVSFLGAVSYFEMRTWHLDFTAITVNKAFKD